MRDSGLNHSVLAASCYREEKLINAA